MRNENFQGVLNLLQRTLLVKFKIEGNRIIVSKIEKTESVRGTFPSNKLIA